MSPIKKHNPNNIEANVITRSLKDIGAKSGNLYHSLAIIAKRSNQISVQLKEELHKKLEEFATTTDNLEEVFENREQIEISRYYEKLPNSCILAVEEFLEEKIYTRMQDEEE